MVCAGAMVVGNNNGGVNGCGHDGGYGDGYCGGCDDLRWVRWVIG